MPQWCKIHDTFAPPDHPWFSHINGLPVFVHILLPETDNCPSWMSGTERMRKENISWSIYVKEYFWWIQRELNSQPPDHQLNVHRTKPPRLALSNKSEIRLNVFTHLLLYFLFFLHFLLVFIFSLLFRFCFFLVGLCKHVSNGWLGCLLTSWLCCAIWNCRNWLLKCVKWSLKLHKH